jgi:hypothetical protein
MGTPYIPRSPTAEGTREHSRRLGAQAIAPNLPAKQLQAFKVCCQERYQRIPPSTAQAVNSSLYITSSSSSFIFAAAGSGSAHSFPPIATPPGGAGQSQPSSPNELCWVLCSQHAQVPRGHRSAPNAHSANGDITVQRPCRPTLAPRSLRPVAAPAPRLGSRAGARQIAWRRLSTSCCCKARARSARAQRAPHTHRSMLSEHTATPTTLQRSAAAGLSCWERRAPGQSQQQHPLAVARPPRAQHAIAAAPVPCHPAGQGPL